MRGRGKFLSPKLEDLQNVNTPVRPVRSLFISDAHLGFRYCRADALLECVASYRPEYLYIVGDLLDGWRLKRKWHWPPVYDAIVDRILHLAREGTRVSYTAGNHDDFLRGSIPEVPGIAIADQFLHTTADGKLFVVTHGDLFDSVEKGFKGLSMFGSRIYDLATAGNQLANVALRRVGLPESNLCFWLKRASKRLVGTASRFESALVGEARRQNCDGVICGHLHWPCIETVGDLIYCNTGDWVEHRSALIEEHDGSMTLLDGERVITNLPAREFQAHDSASAVSAR